MTTTTLEFKTVMQLLAAVFGAQVVLNLMFAFVWPLNLPLAVVGITQLLPGLIVLTLAPAYRATLFSLLRAKPNLKRLLVWWAWSAIMICLCTGTVFAFGFEASPFDLSAIERYPFVQILPQWAMSPMMFLLFLLTFGPFLHLINASGEEFFWRGYLLDGLTARYGERTANIGSAVAWGAWHIPMVVMIGWVFPQPLLGSVLFTISLTSWGIVLGYLRQKDRSLWIPIAMHAVANAFTLGFYDLIASPASNIFTSPWGIAGTLLTLPFALLLLSRTRA